MSLTNTPPATWESGQLVNPERLNENTLAAVEQLTGFARQKWNRWTASTNIGAISPSGTSTWTLPGVSIFDYAIERIVVYGDISGTDAVLSWGDAFLNPTMGELPLNEGTVDGYSPSRGTAFPGYTLTTTTDWTKVFAITITANTSTCSNIRVEVGLRSLRSEASMQVDLSSLYRAGDTLSAASFIAQQDLIQTFADDWTDGYATYPFEMHYVEFLNSNSTEAAELTKDALPGYGTETVVRVLARAEMSSAGAAGQDVTVRCSFGRYVDTPTIIGSFSVDGETEVNYSSGALFIRKTDRTMLGVNNDTWLVVQGTTDDTISFTRLGIWIIKHKI